MSATLLGEYGIWGLGSTQTGLILQSQSENTTSKEVEVMDENGETVGLSMFDERCEITLQGLATSSGPFDSRLAATVVAANAFSDHLTSATASGFGRSVLKSVRRDSSNEDFKKFDAGLVLYAFMSTS